MMDSEERQRFADAVRVANIPTLLMVLVQLSGELRWLKPPYRPAAARGMGDNDTGGLPAQIQQEIRDAALHAILAWRAGVPIAIPEPSPELLVTMLSCAMAEAIPPEYGPMTAAQLGLTPFTEQRPIDVPDGFSVLVIGAGVSGLCAAYYLDRAGIPFVAMEKSAHVGGTWRENRYPGAGVDTPNHLYSFSFAPYDWSMYFALRDELHAYLEDVADRFALRDKFRFETEVVSLAYEAANQRWAVTVRHRDGSTEVVHATVVISATGIFSPASIPSIDGLDSFEGPRFHTANWPDDLDVAGKRVTIFDNRAICSHAGHCTDGLKSVFLYGKEPWIDPDGAAVEEVIATIRKCPSGALSYAINGVEAKDVEALASVVHPADDIGASISSGSFRTLGMIVAPCSIRSLSEIASGVTSGLLTRAADVVLKERRRLVLLVREAPLHSGHLKSMLAASEMGAIIVPPVPAFYFRPTTLDEVIDQTIGRSLDLFGLDSGLVPRWGETIDVGSSRNADQAD